MHVTIRPAEDSSSTKDVQDPLEVVQVQINRLTVLEVAEYHVNVEELDMTHEAVGARQVCQDCDREVVSDNKYAGFGRRSNLQQMCESGVLFLDHHNVQSLMSSQTG
ncbi:hypothetical protein EVAR_48086_1 [Eumeta japonica]|uniref:Uncharacterized protein n=1 Tax=Eumeta variegata TaxID=151549 RepID=A0A4C1XK78_EUMVA|nr:hypothetical protein EVAR_48086_1 [Eumeta japonica]